MDESSSTDKDVATPPQTWEQDPDNPLNWPTGQKFKNTFIASIAAFTASVGTSLPSSATFQYQEEFGVTITQSILPVSMYVFALGLGPVLGGPLSETIGRHPIYAGSMFFGALFTLGSGLTHNFGALCFLRFMAGFCFSPSLSVGAGTISDMFHLAQRGLPSTLFVLMPFLGPGFGPVIGSFIVVRKGWRWTQWTLIFFATASLLAALAGKETYHPVLERRRAKKLGHPIAERPPLRKQMFTFLRISLVRPLHMLFTEPIITFVALYVACEFATLFAFFAGVPFVFSTVHGFTIEQQGLVFLSIVIGCLLGAITIIVLTVVLYLPQVKRLYPERVQPEYRLFPAMFGSIGLPVSLFMFGWTARDDISWTVPAFAIIIFAWGNLCVFVSTMQYTVDTYTGANVASGASANGFARYTLAGILPLFTVQMYRALGIPWAASLLAFVALALTPLPWVLRTVDCEYITVKQRCSSFVRIYMSTYMSETSTDYNVACSGEPKNFCGGHAIFETLYYKPWLEDLIEALDPSSPYRFRSLYRLQTRQHLFKVAPPKASATPTVLLPLSLSLMTAALLVGRLQGKVPIVTGSGRENGIGAGIALAFARNGASVVVNYVSDSSKVAPPISVMPCAKLLRSAS
ncbi:hypothetical protein ACHAQH_007979 [Verticillium albo-atrum]